MSGHVSGGLIGTVVNSIHHDIYVVNFGYHTEIRLPRKSYIGQWQGRLRNGAKVECLIGYEATGQAIARKWCIRSDSGTTSITNRPKRPAAPVSPELLGQLKEKWGARHN